MDNVIRQKLHAAVTRGSFRTIDLFAGCGGMTLGFHRGKFTCVGSVEIDDDARHSHEINFSRFAEPGAYCAFKDVTTTEPEETVRQLSPLIPDPMSAIDVVIGGPPCQAFSRLGRARLWQLAGRTGAHADDERATMYEHFLRFVTHLRPLAFVMENVREIGKFVGKNVAEEIAVTAEELGYEVRYTLLNAVWYGVPQLRERMIIIGIHKSLCRTPSFPVIKYEYDLPVGYSTARAGTGHVEVLPPFDHYVDHMTLARQSSPAVTAQDAFADLPPIFSHLDGRNGKGVPRDPDQRTEYLADGNRFTFEMRNWPDFKNRSDWFTGHVIRYTPRDYETFRRMPSGGMYPEALETAESIFLEKLAILEKELGRPVHRGTVRWEALHKSIVPPYTPGRYPNKFRKMWPDHPARTVPAHIGKDSYSHIHFDSDQARSISLREAARLQSFPDAFRFAGSMNSQLRQIGNAVPPLLAFAVASQLRRDLMAAARSIFESTDHGQTEHRKSRVRSKS